MALHAPVHHPLVNPTTGMLTPPWVSWFQQQSLSVSTLLAGISQRGSLAARPEASAVPVGTLYAITNSGTVVRSDGTTWQSFA